MGRNPHHNPLEGLKLYRGTVAENWLYAQFDYNMYAFDEYNQQAGWMYRVPYMGDLSRSMNVRVVDLSEMVNAEGLLREIARHREPVNG